MRVRISVKMREQLERIADKEEITPEKVAARALKEWLILEKQNRHSIKLLKRGIF
jgi:predicted transcriptional regulator